MTLFIQTTKLFQEVNDVQKWFGSMMSKLPGPVVLLYRMELETIALLQAEGEFMLLAYELYHDPEHDDHICDESKFMCSIGSAVSHITKQAQKEIQRRNSGVTKRNQKENKRDEDNRSKKH